MHQVSAAQIDNYLPYRRDVIAVGYDLFGEVWAHVSTSQVVVVKCGSHKIGLLISNV